MNLIWNAGLIVALLAATACSGPTEGKTPPVSAQLTATLNGAPYRPTNVSAVLSGAGNFVIASSVGVVGPAVTLRLFSIGKPGTYPLGVTPSVIGGAGDVGADGTSFTTPSTGAAGTVTITAVTRTRIAGTFSFVATRTVNFFDTDSRTVTSGSFDVPVKGSGTLDIPANIGSTVTGAVRDSAFFATQVTVVDVPSNGKLRLDLRQESRRVTLSIPDFAGVGTYQLGYGYGIGRIMQLFAPIGNFSSEFGGSELTTTGTVTITSVSAARVQGTIAASLFATFAPINTAPALISINFDIGLP